MQMQNILKKLSIFFKFVFVSQIFPNMFNSQCIDSRNNTSDDSRNNTSIESGLMLNYI